MISQSLIHQCLPTKHKIEEQSFIFTILLVLFELIKCVPQANKNKNPCVALLAAFWTAMFAAFVCTDFRVLVSRPWLVLDMRPTHLYLVSKCSRKNEVFNDVK